jgi:hypothetical protein
MNQDGALKRAITTLENNKRRHYGCVDPWYSCPKHEDGCADESQGLGQCNCGADKANQELDEVIKVLEQALAAPVKDPVAKVCHDLEGHIGWNPRLIELPEEGTELFTAAQPAPARVDPEGENRAVRSFLMLYGQPGLTVGQMKKHLSACGFKLWPSWVETEPDGAHLTKSGAQFWIRYLFALEATTPATYAKEDLDSAFSAGFAEGERSAIKAQEGMEPAAVVITREYEDGSPAGHCLEWCGRNEADDFPVGTKFYTAQTH